MHFLQGTFVPSEHPESEEQHMDSPVEIIKSKYGQTATLGLSSEQSGVKAVAEAFGYSAEELAAIPAEANMGLSCGNPIATARLKSGEVVVDLGSGGGLDVFLASQQVGPGGRAIGIDMTPEMLELARRNAQMGPDGKPYENVEFLQGQIDDLPLPDASAEVIISNCVINLAPDKNQVFREMFRVLKPGGRVAVSDIALKKALPEEVGQNILALVGCIAGAISVSEYQEGLKAAGFREVVIIDSKADLNAYAMVEGVSCCSDSGQQSASCCQPERPEESLHQHLRGLLAKYDVNDYAASVKVFALKGE